MNRGGLTAHLPGIKVAAVPEPEDPMLLLAGLLLLTLSHAPATAGQAPPEALDPAAVRAVLNAQAEAWNRGDLEGYMRGYWESDSLTFFGGGDVTRGWKPTLERYTRRYRGEGREMGHLTLEVIDLAVVARGQAFVRGAWSLDLKGGHPHGLFTLWLRHFPGTGWRVVHDHSSSAAP
jgi:ketosteroid isomerase-like protein